MIRIYLDSSAYTKVFVDEVGSQSATDIIKLAESTDSIQIITSAWTINETISAVDKKAYQKNELIVWI